jgi:Bacterial extracellular solute-binding proteins, family 5 Middle.
MKKHPARIIAALLLTAAITFSAISFTGCASAKTTPTAAPAPTPHPTATPEPQTYTFNRALTLFPTNWNPHSYATSADAELLSYLSAGLYAFDMNKAGDGFRLDPCMAAAEPTDITEELIGSFGLEEGDTCRAYSIPLRPDLCWQDGTPITAADFVNSARRLLDPKAENPHAGMLSEGELALVGAARYLDQVQPIHLENATNAYYTMEDLHLNEEGIYCTPDEQTVALALDYPLEHLLYGETLRFYVETYGENAFDLRSWDSLLRRMDKDGLVTLTAESYLLFEGLVTGNPNWGDTAETIPDYFVYHAPAPPVSWDEVGILARSEDELVLVLQEPLSGFDLLYALTDCWLVKTDLYDACTVEVKGRYINTYGTTPQTTMSCGPYILSDLSSGEICYLTRNPLYFSMETDEGWPLYQTTDIVLEYIPDEGERMERFRGGQLDSCLLGETQREEFEGLSCCRSIPGDTCYLMVFNPDFEALSLRQAESGESINKTILPLPEFRQAMSLALDRDAFCKALSPANRPALTLFTPLIIADLSGGIPYRATEQARAVVTSLWGDDADTNGYDPEKAKELFDLAWEKALAAGYASETDKVEICVGLPTASDYYLQGYELLKEQFTEAVEDTALERKLRFTCVEDLGSECYDALRENRVDMLFGLGWAGAPVDPHGLMEAYISDDYRYDPAWDTSEVRLTVAIHGESYTASVMDWYEIMCGGTRSVTGPDGITLKFTCGAEGNPGIRLDILAALEAAVLGNYDVIPMSEGRTFQLWGDQVCCALEEYVFGLGFGGVKYLTYNYSDREWADHVAACGGVIDYS